MVVVVSYDKDGGGEGFESVSPISKNKNEQRKVEAMLMRGEDFVD